MFFRRKEMPWEVVHSCSVEPVPVYYEDDDDDLDSIVSVKDHTVRRTYILELKKPAKDANVHRKAVLFAQERLLEEVTQNGYNTLLQESWTLTLLRRGDVQRIQVEYSATPARSLRTIKRRQPPFMAVLQAAY
ncbi:hypothetical protein BJ165DRAFT_1529547 [Panaeolus papilionaceus]|nr:hypothetical protein BJ165DRAFT_1529547 [Panaeolus papilionaceus]